MSINKLCLKNFNSIFIDASDYSDIEELIKKNLIGLCWGTENEEYYNINDVILEFLDRFERKSEEQKYGFIGEFLYYLYVLKNVDVIRPISLFFNQEEKSFKKGFDLLGYDGNEFWYSEVKSGDRKNKDINEYNSERLATAFFDIKGKLKFENRNKNYWDTAKANVCKFKLSGGENERKKIINLLTSDKNTGFLNNIIIVSVIFDDSITSLDISYIKEKYEKFKTEKENITIVCIRKRTVDKIINILEGLCV